MLLEVLFLACHVGQLMLRIRILADKKRIYTDKKNVALLVVIAV